MKFTTLAKFIFLPIGVILLFSASGSFTSTQNFLNSANRANGIVLELVPIHSNDSITYAPVIEFETDAGEYFTFKSNASSNPPSYDENDIVEVIYQDNAPQDAQVNGLFTVWSSVIFLVIFGVVFMVPGSVIIYLGIKKQKLKKYLMQHGISTEAKIINVAVNSSLKVNGKNPYKISAQWEHPATKQMITFKSNNIWKNPRNYIKGNTITVLVDENNPESYYMDTSFIPN